MTQPREESIVSQRGQWQCLKYPHGQSTLLASRSTSNIDHPTSYLHGHTKKPPLPLNIISKREEEWYRQHSTARNRNRATNMLRGLLRSLLEGSREEGLNSSSNLKKTIKNQVQDKMSANQKRRMPADKTENQPSK